MISWLPVLFAPVSFSLCCGLLSMNAAACDVVAHASFFSFLDSGVLAGRAPDVRRCDRADGAADEWRPSAVRRKPEKDAWRPVPAWHPHSSDVRGPSHV